MPENESQTQSFDWSVTTFEGSRREQLRRWARLPLEQVIAALEEMQELSYELAATRNTTAARDEPQAAAMAQDPSAKYGAERKQASGKNERFEDDD